MFKFADLGDGGTSVIPLSLPSKRAAHSRKAATKIVSIEEGDSRDDVERT